ncbi:hypothetical protein BRI6_0429 [plant metagenome]|uniref:Uncharacterized protein n=1 Tax=plant metagenome TaxID=1297885 RepID=A0A484TLR4_9ZZZZ
MDGAGAAKRGANHGTVPGIRWAGNGMPTRKEWRTPCFL